MNSQNGARAVGVGDGLSQSLIHTGTDLGLLVPPALLEAIAQRVADLVVEQLGGAPEPWLDLKAAADYLSCPESTIYAMGDSGRLPVYKRGASNRYRRSDLDAALEAKS